MSTETQMIKWVSVDDRKPPSSEARPPEMGKAFPVRRPVLVATAEGRVFETLYAGVFGFANLNSTDRVTHWMPLPDPPIREPESIAGRRGPATNEDLVDELSEAAYSYGMAMMRRRDDMTEIDRKEAERDESRRQLLERFRHLEQLFEELDATNGKLVMEIQRLNDDRREMQDSAKAADHDPLTERKEGDDGE